MGTPSRGAVFPPPYLEFLQLFNDNRFWDAHEALEGPWRQNRSNFYKGLIIFASAYVHVQRGNPVGVGKQMAKVLHYLPPYRPAYLGLDVDGILAEAARAREQVRGREGLRGDREALQALVPFPRIVLAPGRVRGDEPELAEPRPATPPGGGG